MTKQEALGLFAVAGIEVLNIKPLPDGYGYSPEDPRYFLEKPRCVWWFVKTKVGWIEIGWRKRVIHIDWSDTPVRKIITLDNVTKEENYVHAWDMMLAMKYLTALSEQINLKLSEQKS